MSPCVGKYTALTRSHISPNKSLKSHSPGLLGCGVISGDFHGATGPGAPHGGFVRAGPGSRPCPTAPAGSGAAGGHGGSSVIRHLPGGRGQAEAGLGLGHSLSGPMARLWGLETSPVMASLGQGLTAPGGSSGAMGELGGGWLETSRPVSAFGALMVAMRAERREGPQGPAGWICCRTPPGPTCGQQRWQRGCSFHQQHVMILDQSHHGTAAEEVCCAGGQRLVSVLPG